MTTKGISKNSLIHTENGFKNVEDVVIGDCVLNENNEFKKIVDIKVSSSNDTYIVNGMCFDEIVCSADQEFLVKERYIIKDEKYHPVKKIRETPVWKPIKDMEKGEYMCVSINSKSELPKWEGSYYNQFGHHRLVDKLSKHFENPSFWYLMGRYVGDGWTRRNYNNGESYRGAITICCSKKKTNDYDTLKEAFDKCGFNITITNEKTVYKMSLYSVEIYDFV